MFSIITSHYISTEERMQIVTIADKNHYTLPHLLRITTINPRAINY